VGDFVTVHQTYSPVEADMLGDVLRGEGIEARVVGTRYGSVIGAGENVCQVRIEVPPEQYDRAAELIDSIVDAGEDLLADQADDDEEERDAAEPAPLRWMLAVGCSFAVIIPAAGHLYARRRWVWLVLLGAWIWSLMQAFQLDWSSARIGLVGLGLVLAVDIVGGVVGVRAYNLGRRPGTLFQLGYGAALGACVIGGTLVIGPRLPAPKSDVTYLPVIDEAPFYDDFSGLPADEDLQRILEHMDELNAAWEVPEPGTATRADAGTPEWER